MHKLMLQQINPSEKSLSEFSKLFKVVKINSLLRAANIRKISGVKTQEIFNFIFLLAFYGKKMNRFLASKSGSDLPGKDVYYRFLNNPKYSWRRFLLQLSGKVTDTFDHLTSDKRVRVFILDDSILSRPRTKNAELLARVFDHTSQSFIKGYTMLTLGWSDGYSFVPVDFAMLSSAKPQNRYNDISDKVDKRTNGAKRRAEAIIVKPKNVIRLIENALNTGITADYVLMDSWFTNEPMIGSILEKGLHSIGMVKQVKQRYNFNGQLMSLSELRSTIKVTNNSEIIGSRYVKTKNGIPVKIVFIKNRNNKREWLALLSTDLNLGDAEIIRIYGMRWSIEVFFKNTKSLLKLGSEFQGNCFDMLISHTTIVFTRYIVLEWERRHNQDSRSYGELFYLLCDEIQDIDYETAIRQLMLFFSKLVNGFSSEFIKELLCQARQWIATLPLYIRTLMPNLDCEL